MSEKRAIPIGVGVLVLILALDYITKRFVRTHMTLGEAIPSEDSFFSIRYALNDGVAFNMFEGHRTPLILMQSVLVVVVFVIMIVVLRHMFSFPILCAFALMLGGGIGNLSDRIRFGQVTDFFSVGSFPIFNIADSALTVGCALLLLCVLRSERKSARSKEREHTHDAH
ncbi:MAG: signal peptidase II [Clostridiales Family XIII bacterium]|nr:signal peptidase II [Clostridiales Family XIII bacterium]